MYSMLYIQAGWVCLFGEHIDSDTFSPSHKQRLNYMFVPQNGAVKRNLCIHLFLTGVVPKDIGLIVTNLFFFISGFIIFIYNRSMGVLNLGVLMRSLDETMLNYVKDSRYRFETFRKL